MQAGGPWAFMLDSPQPFFFEPWRWQEQLAIQCIGTFSVLLDMAVIYTWVTFPVYIITLIWFIILDKKIHLNKNVYESVQRLEFFGETAPSSFVQDVACVVRHECDNAFHATRTALCVVKRKISQMHDVGFWGAFLNGIHAAKFSIEFVELNKEKPLNVKQEFHHLCLCYFNGR